MYYISKFCRICIQTGVKLLDLDTLDFDEVKLSDKLEACTRMVVNRESLSTEICVHCITKLRISYQFHNMCRKSTKTLQGYLEALFCANSEPVPSEKLVKSELNVVVAPLNGCLGNNVSLSSNIQTHREKRKRITKEQRCSLLKRLLTPTENFRKERDKYSYDPSITYNDKGGLKDIIRFTKNYEFGKIDKNSNYEPTPLDKLTAFSKEFFRKDFSEFKNTVLYIIENRNNLDDNFDSDEENFFSSPEEEEDTKENILKFEEVIIEPDIKIKTEPEYEDEEGSVYEPYVSIECKKEVEEKDPTSHYYSTTNASCPVPGSFNGFPRGYPATSSIQLLDSMVGGYHENQRRTFSQSNVRCRTRDNPYINPMLKNQFLYRSFKCEKCNRYFKSQGYLKAHFSKVH
ncbi:hypothetical protein NQ315_015839 [Exocentrus adspersus]|uniref:C2H2-type domain-containing protein n=1 Tax=Exocentrus adspersus TaxID=1586481 RepID=A0AAV8W3G4_9CUCU|nr:hypothetical protein NQ315_015839 [Exocentrus adspersus]